MRDDSGEWTHTGTQVLALLTEFDVYGLQPGGPDGCPEDEYAPEATQLARHLTENGTIDLAAVDAIWLHWFSQTMSEAAGPARTAEFVERLNALALPPAPLDSMS